jgi:hypothetical protein
MKQEWVDKEWENVGEKVGMKIREKKEKLRKKRQNQYGVGGERGGWGGRGRKRKISEG